MLKKIKKGLAYIGLSLALAYPIFVGVGTAYISSGFKKPTTEMSYVQNWNIPTDENVLVLIRPKIEGGEVDSVESSPHCFSLFNLVILQEITGGELVDKIKTEFYHEIGHIVFKSFYGNQHEENVTNTWSEYKTIFEDEESVVRWLERKSLEYLSRSDEKGIEYLIEENKQDVWKISDSRDSDSTFISSCPNPDEFYAIQFEGYFGTPQSELPRCEYLIDGTINVELKNKPRILTTHIGNLPAIYGHMFVQGFKHIRYSLVPPKPPEQQEFILIPELEEEMTNNQL